MDGPETGANTEWRVSNDLVGYEDALAVMEQRVADIRSGNAPELIGRFPVHRTGRGGRYTYHGPGQRVAYVMVDLKRRGPDVRQFVRNLEAWVIATLAAFGVRGERREDRVGIWVVQPDGTEAKIAAIGVRIRHWVTFHGIAINVNPNLEHFHGIIPCGAGMVSFAEIAAE